MQVPDVLFASIYLTLKPLPLALSSSSLPTWELLNTNQMTQHSVIRYVAT